MIFVRSFCPRKRKIINIWFLKMSFSMIIKHVWISCLTKDISSRNHVAVCWYGMLWCCCVAAMCCVAARCCSCSSLFEIALEWKENKRTRKLINIAMQDISFAHQVTILFSFLLFIFKLLLRVQKMSYKHRYGAITISSMEHVRGEWINGTIPNQNQNTKINTSYSCFQYFKIRVVRACIL